METLLIFARAPVKGGVKTRLAESAGLGAEDTLLMATHTGARPALAYIPTEGRHAIEEIPMAAIEVLGLRVVRSRGTREKGLLRGR